MPLEADMTTSMHYRGVYTNFVEYNIRWVRTKAQCLLIAESIGLNTNRIVQMLHFDLVNGKSNTNITQQNPEMFISSFNKRFSV